MRPIRWHRTSSASVDVLLSTMTYTRRIRILILDSVIFAATSDLVDCNRGHFADHDATQRVGQARVTITHDELDHATVLLQPVSHTNHFGQLLDCEHLGDFDSRGWVRHGRLLVCVMAKMSRKTLVRQQLEMWCGGSEAQGGGWARVLLQSFMRCRVFSIAEKEHSCEYGDWEEAAAAAAASACDGAMVIQ